MKLSAPNTTKIELRNFGLIFGSFFAFVFGLLLPFIFSGNYRLWPWIVAGIFIVWALIHSPSLLPVYRLWMKIGLVLNFVNTRLILGLIFYVLFFPMGFVMRLFGWDAMQRNFQPDHYSYRIESMKSQRSSIKNPF